MEVREEEEEEEVEEEEEEEEEDDEGVGADRWYPLTHDVSRGKRSLRGLGGTNSAMRKKEWERAKETEEKGE